MSVTNTLRNNIEGKPFFEAFRQGPDDIGKRKRTLQNSFEQALYLQKPHKIRYLGMTTHIKIIQQFHLELEISKP